MLVILTHLLSFLQNPVGLFLKVQRIYLSFYCLRLFFSYLWFTNNKPIEDESRTFNES